MPTFFSKNMRAQTPFYASSACNKASSGGGGANKKALSISFSPYVRETRRDAVVGRIKGDIFEWDPANNAIFSAHCCCTHKQGLVLASLRKKRAAASAVVLFSDSFLSYLPIAPCFLLCHPPQGRSTETLYFFFLRSHVSLFLSRIESTIKNFFELLTVHFLEVKQH